VRRRWGRHRRHVLFALVAVGLFFALIEAVLRLGGWATLPAEELFTDAYDIGYTMRPGAANPWTDAIEFLNAAGFRGPDTPRERRPGVVRVMCLGDSTTFGAGVAYEEAYPSVLASLLGARGMSVEVMNAGIPGSALWKQRVIYENYLRTYDPDLLVLYTNYGYREDYLRLRLDMERDPLKWSVRRLAARSHIYRLLRLWLRPPRFAEAVAPSQYDLQRFVVRDADPEVTRQVLAYTNQDLNAVAEACRADGCALLVVPLLSRYTFDEAVARGMRPGPDFYDWHRRNNSSVRVGEAARRAGIVTLDAAPAFLEASYRERQFRDEVHFTVVGHRLMAELIDAAIAKQGLLDAVGEKKIAKEPAAQ